VRFVGQLLLVLVGLVIFGPLMVSVSAALVAMFAAFVGLDDLKVAAGAVSGAGAFLFFALMMMGGGELLSGLSAFESKPQQSGLAQE
jgi:hypothetical protein